MGGLGFKGFGPFRAWGFGFGGSGFGVGGFGVLVLGFRGFKCLLHDLVPYVHFSRECTS